MITPTSGDLLEADVAAPADERRRFVRAGMDEFREHAFHHVSLDTIAARADRTPAQVQVHFPTVDDLVQAVVHTWYSERMGPIAPIADRFGAVQFLRAIVAANLADPGLMRLLAALVNVCATEDHPLSALLQQQWMRFHALVQRTLAQDVATGREPDTMDSARGAEQLIALYEGLQLQSMVRPAMDLLGAYDRAVTRLRDGWSQQYSPPVWEI